MELQFLGEEVFRKDNRHVFACKAIEGDSFNCKNIICLRVANYKEVRSILRFREMRNEYSLMFRVIQSLQVDLEHCFTTLLQALIL